MDLQYIYQFTEPVVVGICLCIGYIIKTSLDFIPNKYIPLILAIFGVCMSALSRRCIDVNVILTGMCSGLASTGAHQIVKNLSQQKDTQEKIKPEPTEEEKTDKT